MAGRAESSRAGSGRTELIRHDGGCVVAKETVSEGVSWITFTRVEESLEPSEERAALQT